MKILIIEDKPKHILSAEKFAKESGHEVTIVTGYDEAERVLCPPSNDVEGEYYRFGRSFQSDFDVVLTDLFLPVSTTGQADRNISGEMPYGISLLLLAMRSGIKNIGLLTDGNHHAHPFIWALDPLGGYRGNSFTIGDIKLLFASNGFVYHGQLMTKTDLTVDADSPLIGAKAWGILLDKLLSDE